MVMATEKLAEPCPCPALPCDSFSFSMHGLGARRARSARRDHDLAGRQIGRSIERAPGGGRDGGGGTAPWPAAAAVRAPILRSVQRPSRARRQVLIIQ
jgi:hypothetical protein